MKTPTDNSIDLAEIYSAFYKRSIEGLFILNKNLTIRLANPRGEKLLGYRRGELVNKKLLTLIPENLKKECLHLCKHFFDKTNHSSPIKKTVSFLKKNNDEIIAEVSLSDHLHDTEGPLMVVLFSDITAQVIADKKLEKTKNLYEDVLEDLGDAFISIDSNWKFTYVNNTCLELMGAKGKEIFNGKVVWDLFPELKGTIYEKKYQEVMKTRKQASFESPSVYRDRWYDVRICPHNGGIAVFSRDITEVKQKTLALQESEERFSKAFRSSPIAFAISRLADGRFIEVNDSFIHLFGYKPEEIIGKTSTELGFYKYGVAHEREKLVKILKKEGNVKNHEIIIGKKTGTKLNILFSTEEIELYNERNVFTTFMDITEKRKAEEAMIRLNEHLEKSVCDRTIKLTEALEREKENNDLKSRFVSMASHEFRTPLAGLLTSVSILEEYTKEVSNDKIKKHFKRIKSSVDMLTGILNDFLSLEKLEQGKNKAENCNFDLNEMIIEVMYGLKDSLKTGQHIHYHQAGEILMYQDEKKIRNTLLNLINNASKYSGEGKPIELAVEIKKEIIKVIVKDNGIGIPKKDQQNMFSLFFRARNAETIQGTGLGLMIVKKYMELIGGAIDFKSVENKGSTFTVLFPKNAHSKLKRSRKGIINSEI